MGRTKVFVGGIPVDTKERHLKRFFEEFDVSEIIIVKNSFAFVQFESRRDAEDAVHDTNGKKLLGKRVNVEIARDKPIGQNRSAISSYKANHIFRGGYKAPIRTKHRLTVENLSSSISWQALKTYMGQAGVVTYGEAHRPHRNMGEVDFLSRSDLKAAIKLLDGTKLNGQRIRLLEKMRITGYRSSSSSHSRSLSSALRRRTRSPSPVRSHCYSKTRSRIRSRSRNRSCCNSTEGYTSHRSSTSGLSRSRSRSGSVTRGLMRKRTLQDRSRSRSRSSRSIEDYRAKTEEYSCSRSRSRSRSGSVTRDLVRKRTFQDRSRSRSISSGSIGDFRANSKTNSPSRTPLGLPRKRLKLYGRS